LSRRGTVPALKDILEAVERIQRYIGPMEPERLGLLAAIGIEKGKPFAPDARMKKILTEAAAVGKATEPSSTGRTASDAIFRDVRQPGHLSQRLDCGHQARRSVGGDRTDAGIQG
jgi:hypothetical protein